MDPKHKEERRAFNEALRARLRMVAAARGVPDTKMKWIGRLRQSGSGRVCPEASPYLGLGIVRRGTADDCSMVPAGDSRRAAMSELTPQHVLVDLFDSDDWPDSIPEPETAAEIVVQRLIDASFAIEAQERART
jgi:hypothetical protein